MTIRPTQRIDRALLIGIDRYQFIGPNLRGCVADVEAMRDLLVSRLHTPVAHVTLLTASREGGEAAASLASRANIVASLLQLASLAEPGEQVYIHYSGHGVRNEYTILPGLEPDGKDEAIVPADAGYVPPAEHYLLDKELGWLIGRVTDKGAFVTVVMDCCHSASGTRDVGEQALYRKARPKDADVSRRVAGPDGGDPRPRTAANLVAPIEALRARVTSDGRPGSLMPAPRNYVLLAACRESETAKEYGTNGVFTHFLLEVLGGDIAGLTYRSLRDRVGGAILKLASSDRRYTTQTPQLEGDGRLVVFGGGSVLEPTAFDATPQAGGTVLLPGSGEAVGITVETVLALYPPGATNLDDPANELGAVIVREIRSSQALAEPIPGTDPGRLVPGMRAVIIQPGSARVRRRVAFVGEGPEIDAARHAVATIGRPVAPKHERVPSSYLEVVARDDRPELSVAVREGRFVILDESDSELPRMAPLPVALADAAMTLARRLEHVVRYRNAWDLRNESPGSHLSNRLAITVDRLGDRHAGQVELCPGESVTFRVYNRSGRPSNAALLYFGPDWSVSRLWPDGDSPYAELASSEEGLAVTSLIVTLPPGVSEALERLKMFATERPSSFDALVLPSLDEPRSLTRSIPKNPLEAMLADLSAASRTSAQRDLVTRPGTGDWATAELELRTRR